MPDNSWLALALSLKVAGYATLGASLLGISLGYLLARTRFYGRDLLESLLTLPMVLPPTVLGYYLLVLLGRQGAIGQFLYDTWQIQLIFSWQGAVIAAMLVALPLILKPARAAFEQVDPQYEQAARVLGLNEWAIFWRITLPLAWRGLMAGVLLGFVRCLGEFGATLMIAGSIPGETQTLSIAIYEAVQAGQDAQAEQLVLLVSGVCLLMLLLANRWLPRRPS